MYICWNKVNMNACTHAFIQCWNMQTTNLISSLTNTHTPTHAQMAHPNAETGTRAHSNSITSNLIHYRQKNTFARTLCKPNHTDKIKHICIYTHIHVPARKASWGGLSDTWHSWGVSIRTSSHRCSLASQTLRQSRSCLNYAINICKYLTEKRINKECKTKFFFLNLTRL